MGSGDIMVAFEKLEIKQRIKGYTILQELITEPNKLWAFSTLKELTEFILEEFK